MFAYVNCYYGVIHEAVYVKRFKTAIKGAAFSSQNSDNALLNGSSEAKRVIFGEYVYRTPLLFEVCHLPSLIRVNDGTTPQTTSRLEFSNFSG
jgi:hypothetical protein